MKAGKYIITGLAVLIWALTGCGKQEEKKGITEVLVWAHEGQPAEKTALEEIFAAFNREHKHIQVKVEFKQEQGYGDRLNAAAVAGKLPDVVDVDGPYTAHLAENGVLVPLDSLISAEMKADFLPTVIAQGTYKGRLYTLGAFESTVVVYYNRDIMNLMGITPPASVDSAWSWEEFLDVLRALKIQHPELIPLETFMAWPGEWLTYAFTPLIWSKGGSLLSQDASRAQGHVNGPSSVRALKQWQKLFIEKLSDRSAPPGQFRQSKAVMCWGIFNRWPIYMEAGINFGMMPLPKLIKLSSPSGSWCWGITSGGKNPEAAFKVVEWLVNPEQGIVPMCRANGGIPSRESAVKLMPEYVNTRGLFVEQLRKSARARPLTPHYGSLTKELSRALEDIARGADVKTALDKAAEKVEAVLE
jgi:ABC-type glycerol-3-phosphate transport system substrate-binding protein